jgi:hypothetical protein
MWENNKVTLGEARRRRLLAAMAEADVEGLVLYGNAWQGDYLRYGADFGILEGHGIAVVSSDGTLELFLDSATEADGQSSHARSAAAFPAECAHERSPQLCPR